MNQHQPRPGMAVDGASVGLWVKWVLQGTVTVYAIGWLARLYLDLFA